MFERISQCFRRKRQTYGYNIKPFRQKKIPIICITGQEKCGRTTTSKLLAKYTGYYLIRISQLILKESRMKNFRAIVILDYLSKKTFIPDDIVINLITEELINTYEKQFGYIIDGFPLHIRQAKLFEKEICKVTIYIWLLLSLDDLLSRTLTPAANTLSVVEPYLAAEKHMKALKWKYGRSFIIAKTNPSPNDVCLKLIMEMAKRKFDITKTLKSDYSLKHYNQ